MAKERNMKRYKDLSKEVKKERRVVKDTSTRSKLHDKMKPGRAGEKKK